MADRQDYSGEGRWRDERNRVARERDRWAGDERRSFRQEALHDRDRTHFGRHDHDLEPDYVTWRDEQMRRHDRDYETWRAERHRRYDDDYHASRGRGGGAGPWSEQATPAGTSDRRYITPETHDYGARLYNEGPDRPSGRLEFSPGRSGGESRRASSSGGGGGAFMQASPQVRATSEGWGGRGDPEDYDRHWRERDRDDRDEHWRDRERRWRRED